MIEFSIDKKQLAIVIDPDKIDQTLDQIIALSQTLPVSYFFVGGSILIQDNFEKTILKLKETKIPVIIFPGSNYQLSPNADALLMLSLISGRNPDYLIHQQVQASIPIHLSGIQTIPTGYILIDGGVYSSTQYISNTTPIPRDKPEIVAATALAGVQLGMKSIYLEAGSGASIPVSAACITMTKKYCKVPLIIGGGITNAAQAKMALDAGANIIVVGNILEKDPSILTEIASVFI
jgi:phosphoglycerol geranylgeranyltransferase